MKKSIKAQTTLNNMEIIEKSIVWLTEHVNELNQLRLKEEKIDKVEEKPLHDFKVGDKVECEWLDKPFDGVVVGIDIEIHQIKIKLMNGTTCNYDMTKDDFLKEVHLIKEVIAPIIPKYAVNDIVLMNPDLHNDIVLMNPDLQVMKIIKVLPSNSYYMKFVANDVYWGEYSEKDILRKIGVAI